MQVTARNGTGHICFLDTKLVAADSDLPQRENFEIFEYWSKHGASQPRIVKWDLIHLSLCSFIHSLAFPVPALCQALF